MHVNAAHVHGRFFRFPVGLCPVRPLAWLGLQRPLFAGGWVALPAVQVEERARLVVQVRARQPCCWIVRAVVCRLAG